MLLNDMTSEMIQVEKTLLYELIEFKIRSINEEIQRILERWHYHSLNTFIDDTRKGILKNAEMDAILLRQLVYDRDELQNKKAGFQDS